MEPKKAVISDPDSGAIQVLTEGISENAISALAYQFWCERGSPVGSDQADWFRAESELKNRTESDAAA